MAIILVQTDTIAPCGTILACTSPADGLATVSQARKAEDGGAAGSGELSVTINKADIQAGVMFESPGIGQTTWLSGTYTVRLNVTTAVANLNLIEVHICRVNSSCVSQETVGSSVGLGISMGTTGVKNVDVEGVEQSANATDRIYIVFIFHAVNHTSPTFGFTPDQNIDTPIAEVQEFVYSGDVPLSPLPDAPKGFVDMVYAGAIPLAMLPDAPVAPLEKSYGGDIPLVALPDFPKAILEKSYAGDIGLVLTPNSIYELISETEFIYAGDIPLVALPSYSSILDRVYAGDTQMLLTPSSQRILDMIYEGDMPVVLTPSSVRILDRVYQGAVVLVLTPESAYLLESPVSEFVYAGDIPVSLLSGYSSILDRLYTGEVGFLILPNSDYSFKAIGGRLFSSKRADFAGVKTTRTAHTKLTRPSIGIFTRKG